MEMDRLEVAFLEKVVNTYIQVMMMMMMKIDHVHPLQLQFHLPFHSFHFVSSHPWKKKQKKNQKIEEGEWWKG